LVRWLIEGRRWYWFCWSRYVWVNHSPNICRFGDVGSSFQPCSCHWKAVYEKRAWTWPLAGLYSWLVTGSVQPRWLRRRQSEGLRSGRTEREMR
jgi:hypothetical protein